MPEDLHICDICRNELEECICEDENEYPGDDYGNLFSMEYE